MARKAGQKKSKSKPQAKPIPSYGADTFSELQAPDSSRPSKRHEELLQDLPSAKRHKNDARSTEGRAARDGERMDFKIIEQAIDNKVILPFRLSDFLHDKHNNKDPSIRIEGGTTYGPLKDTKTRLLEKDGPRLVVDLDDNIILLYCPNFLGRGIQVRDHTLISKHRETADKGMQLELNALLANLVTANPPKKDGTTPDRRGNQSTQTNPTCTPAENGLSPEVVSSKAVSSTTSARSLRVEQRQYVKENMGQAKNLQAPKLETIRGTETCESEEENLADAKEADRTDPGSTDAQISPLQRSVLEPSSYLWSPMLYQSAQEYTLPIQVSSGLGAALSNKSRAATVSFLESKRLLDKRIERVVKILHPGLAEIMAELKEKVLKAQGTAPSQVLENGWTSPFPNYIVAFNRQTGVHRDSKGFENGMDFLILLGKFAGGRLVLQDLNLKLDWKPGFFCALDGYTFTHRVERWEGRQRICLISFCHSSAFRGQKVNCVIPAPTAAGMGERLSKVKAEVQKDRAEKFQLDCQQETDKARSVTSV